MRRFRLRIDGKQALGVAFEAATFSQRAKGLLGRNGLPSAKFLWLRRAPTIHTFGMKFAIDLVFLDRAGHVVNVIPNVPPGRIRCGGFGADSVLEAQAGWLDIDGIKIGDRVVFEPEETDAS